MPFANQLHVDQLLSQISVRYQSAEMVADKVFPIVGVVKDSDLYRTYTRNFRIPETLRANKGKAREHYFEVATAGYLLEHHALKDYVSDRDADNYDMADLRADTTRELTDAILRQMEKKVADLFTSTNWSLNVSLSAATQFSANTTASNPIAIFDTAATVVVQESGFKPNYAIIPRVVYPNVKNHISVAERTKYTSSALTKEMLAALFDVGEILVPQMSYDSAALGIADSVGQIWGDNCFVGYKPASPGPLQPSCGYIFRGKNVEVVRWRDEERAAEAIEVRHAYVPKVVASLSGYLIKDCNA